MSLEYLVKRHDQINADRTIIRFRIADCVRRFYKKKGWTSYKIAQILDVDKSYIHKALAGEKYPSAAMIELALREGA